MILSNEQIREKLRGAKPLLREKFHVKEIGIFGSYARGEATEESDVDILVSFDQVIGWEFFDFKEYLERVLGKAVDLVTVAALKPQLRTRILDEVIYA